MTIQPVTVQYGNRSVFRNFSHSFADGSITAILGPSGCGKTTLLFSIAHALVKTGEPVSFVFQEPRLIPWCTLAKNLELVMNGSEKENRERAHEYLDKVHLLPDASKLPRHISGGERQRVAIARAFSFPSSVLLMDEPFQSQDAGLKQRLLTTFLDLQQSEPRTVLAVTHDIHEALSIADHLLVLGGKPARVVYQGSSSSTTPDELSRILSEESRVFSSLRG
ncbi:MAG TPA: ATP-binding cassette domain-containing protein [Treponemataceae bacterium]|jgi:ABC-type nitrate/sulfonate/bicarbonate transport system ATPase subunit|nr:MAG: Aliphatic sulfonates import ATP-binding protein SsuB [Spirochaetes bacterium ADurb.Bin215]HOU37395.1 ATP-binding cassette domain-containing protein [Treponemataceae bacterium]HPA09833.1 ATP-binding cassette domain-containing protein [Treponemataceae bacterium]HQF72323.1 ATP-binding cassette domain-containing protein [Treponemataceae bacterium]HRR03103.1 ATP-binding cassette domain-containing protein [Treponemataceae bacterium]